MTSRAIINVLDFQADNTGAVKTTAAIQLAVDNAAAQNKKVLIPKGTYSVGAIFLPAHTNLIFEEGAKLVGTTDLNDFPEIPNRVAGVEMDWPAAVINIIDQEDVTISGPGVIDCQGPYWWNLYWGQDQKGGQRAVYDQKNLRWIVDYDVKRVREMLVYRSHDVTISDVTFQRSGFWNLQITYCHDILVKNITVQDNDGPSTDGIDIDSSADVRVTESTIHCNDDCIVVKSGRDGDGYRVNRPSERVEIDHCKIYAGDGITIGSEVSGGIQDIKIHDIEFIGTSCGFRIKSAPERGGFIKNIDVRDLKMTDVRYPIKWVMSWHKAYNTKVFDQIDEMPVAWQAVAAAVPTDKQFTAVHDITVANVKAVLTSDKVESSAFDILAAPQNQMSAIKFADCQIEASELGNIAGIEQLNLTNVNLRIGNSAAIEDTFDNR